MGALLVLVVGIEIGINEYTELGLWDWIMLGTTLYAVGILAIGT